MRPNPEPDLKLRVDATNDGIIKVSGGQPGVFYAFRQEPKGPELTLPVYFHRRDRLDSAQNRGVGQIGVEIDLSIIDEPTSKGLGQTRVGVDFSIIDDSTRAPASGTDLARTYPPLPAIGGSLFVKRVDVFQQGRKWLRRFASHDAS